MVEQGNTTVVPPKSTIIERKGSIVNKIINNDETETEKLLKEILKELKKR